MAASTPAGGEHERILKFVWAGVALFTLYAATLPFDFVTSRAVVGEHVQLTLQQSTLSASGHISAPDVLQNILLFVPFGVLAIVSQRRRRPFGALALAVFLAAILSTACEAIQLFTVDRTTSVWDVAANVAGAFIGAVTWLAVRPLVRGVWHHVELSAVETRHIFPLLCAASLVCVAAWEPFDVTLDVGTVWTKVKPLVHGSLPAWQPLNDELLTSLRFTVLVTLLTEWIREVRPGTRRAPWLSLTACVLLAASLELTQFVITSRSPAIQDFFAASSGALLGALMGSTVVRRARITLLLLIATFIAALPFYLQPFEFARAHRPFTMVPFLAYYEFTSLQTVSHVIDLTLIYAPIGFAMEWLPGKGGVRQAALVVGVMASTLEYAQGWVVGRFPDVTDVGVAILGGIAGAALARYGLDALVAERETQFQRESGA